MKSAGLEWSLPGFITLKPLPFYFSVISHVKNQVIHKISQQSTQYFCQSCGVILSVILEAVTRPVSKERCTKLVSVLVNMNSNKHTKL